MCYSIDTGAHLDARSAHRSPADPQDSDAIKLFVGQIPKHMEEEDLRPVFEEFGEIFDLAVIRDKISGMHRGKGGVGICF